MKLDLIKPLVYRKDGKELVIGNIVNVEDKKYYKRCLGYYKENEVKLPILFTDSGYVLNPKNGKREHIPRIYNVSEDTNKIQSLNKEIEYWKAEFSNLSQELQEEKTKTKLYQEEILELSEKIKTLNKESEFMASEISNWNYNLRELELEVICHPLRAIWKILRGKLIVTDPRLHNHD